MLRRSERRAVEAAAAEAEEERLEQERLAKRGTAPRVVSTALVLSSGNGAGEVPSGTTKIPAVGGKYIPAGLNTFCTAEF